MMRLRHYLELFAVVGVIAGIHFASPAKEALGPLFLYIYKSDCLFILSIMWVIVSSIIALFGIWNEDGPGWVIQLYKEQEGITVGLVLLMLLVLPGWLVIGLIGIIVVVLYHVCRIRITTRKVS